MHTYIVNAATLIACIVIPFVVFIWPTFPKRPKSILARWLTVGLMGWIVLAVGGKLYQFAWFHEERTTGNVPSWDPAFTMMYSYIFGWLLTFIAATPFALVRLIADVFRSRRSANEQIKEAEQAVGGNGGQAL